MKNLICVLILCFVAGCKLPDKGLLDTTPPPFISRAATSPSVIDVTTLGSQPTSPIDTTVVFSASLDPGPAGAMVMYTVLNPAGNVFLSGTMTGSAGQFSASTPFNIQKEDVGTYSVQFQAIAVNDPENTSNILTQTILVKNANHYPVVSNLVMPDTVKVPPSGDTTFVKITVAVADSDGLQDIASVTLTSRRPDNSVVGVYPMYDDGGFNPVSPFGIKSGDAFSGDGVYTLTIPLLSSTTGNTYRDFSFVATDRSGGTSNVLTKRIFIQ
jgi:hypothetical protein